MFSGRLRYLKVPLMHRMWDKYFGVSKLKMVRDMVLEIDSYLAYSFNTVILCDSLYTNCEVLEVHTVNNIPFICDVRCDTALYDVPDIPPADKRVR